MFTEERRKRERVFTKLANRIELLGVDKVFQRSDLEGKVAGTFRAFRFPEH